jgi:hypothetical protein
MKYQLQSLCALLALTIALTSCNSDKSQRSAMSGAYDVRVSLGEVPRQKIEGSLDSAKQEMRAARREMEEEFARAGQEIRKSLDSSGISIEFGSGDSSGENGLAEGFSSLFEGIAKLGEGIGKLGAGLGRAIAENLKFRMNLKEDGSLSYGREGGLVKINFNEDQGQWKVEQGRFLMYGKDDSTWFDIKPTEKGYELVNPEVTLHLERIEEKK